MQLSTQEVKAYLRDKYPELHTPKGRVKSKGIEELRLEQIKLLLPDAEVIGEIGKTSDKVHLKCLLDGHEWTPRLGDVVNKCSGCPTCAGLLPLTNKVVDLRLEGRGILRIGEYVNTNTKIAWRCNKGHQWEALPYSVLNLGSGCPTCALDHNCIYLWNVVGTNNYKIGISSIGIAERRINGCANSGNHKYEIVIIQEVEDASNLEKELLSKYLENPYKNERFDGYTEFRKLTPQQVEDILKTIRSSKNEQYLQD